MSQKLSAQREEEIRSHAEVYPAGPQKAVADLLAELDRIRPEWVPVETQQFQPGRTYEVAATTATQLTPVWMGRARFVETFGGWVDKDTSLPFPADVKVTHYLRTLTPPELIGQPKAE